MIEAWTGTFMTDTSLAPELPAERKPRSRKRGGWWVNDAELIERMGVPEKVARQAIAALDGDKRSGFPQKEALFGDRRFLPAVKAYFEARWGYRIGASPQRGERHG